MIESEIVNHQDHLNLLRPAISGPGRWADLGCGRGAFTLALTELLGPGGEIIAVDKDRRALQDLQRALAGRFPHVEVRTLAADFTRPLDLPPLDGILMANSLHFLRRKQPVLARLRGHLQSAGRFVLVEYNTDRGNLWVPHPLSYPTWARLAAGAGFARTQLISSRPSRFLGEIYSALSEMAAQTDPAGQKPAK